MEKLINYCDSIGITLDDKAVDRFNTYMSIVLNWNSKISRTF